MQVLTFIKSGFSKNVLFLWVSKGSIWRIFKIQKFCFSPRPSVQCWSVPGGSVKYRQEIILLYVNTQYRLNLTICRQTTYILLLFIKMSFVKSISTPKNCQNSSKIKMKHYYKNEKMVISQRTRLKWKKKKKCHQSFIWRQICLRYWKFRNLS